MNKYNERRDKSGYIIPSPDEKLVSFYSKGSGDSSRLGDRIRRLYDKLIDVKSQIFDLDFTDFGKDSEGNPDWYSTSYENILSQFGDSCRDYKIALRSLSKMGDDISGHDYRIRDILDRVKSAEDKIKRIEKALSTQRYW